MKKTFLIAFMLLAATGSIAFALPISGSGALGSFTGEFNYSSTNLQISVSLTNTSPASNGGFLTAFAFNIPNSFTINGIGFSAFGYDFVRLLPPVNATPFGDFDTGAAINNNNPSWEGGGDPSGGVGVSGTGLFTFTLSGNGLLSENDFFNQTDPWFVVRFRGFDNGGSDKVPLSNPVPEPTTMLLLGIGLSGLAYFGRKKFLK
jgi:hypothetical protein